MDKNRRFSFGKTRLFQIAFYFLMLLVSLFYMTANFWKGIVGTWGALQGVVALMGIILCIFSEEGSNILFGAGIATAVLQVPPIWCWMVLPNIEFGFLGSHYRIGGFGLVAHILLLALATGLTIMERKSREFG